MKVRVLYYRRTHPEYKIGGEYDMPGPVGREYVASRAGEPVGAPKVERSTAPPAPERAVEPAAEPAEWPLSGRPEDYLARYEDADESELSEMVRERLALARKLTEG